MREKKIEKNSEKNTKNASNKQKTYAILTGAIAGTINGLFGGGGGMIVVPMLIKLLKIPNKKAHATAILIILPISIISGLFYTAFGNLDLKVGIPTTIGVIGGGVLGALLLSKMSSKWVTIVFAVVMALAGVKLLVF